MPSCNLPLPITSSTEQKLKDKSKARDRRRVDRQIQQDNSEISVENLNFEINLKEIEEAVESLELPQNQVENEIPTYVNIGVQVRSGDLSDSNFSSFLKTEMDLKSSTGIPNFQMLDMFVEIVERLTPRFKFYSGKLSVRDRIILTFMKLKLNNSYAFLNVLFKSVSERHIANIICNILDILGNALKFAIVFPQSEEIRRNIPLCFKDYSDVALILDCTEIEIQKPQSLCCQLLTYSLYKGRFTLKFLTACTPGGLLSYVSPAYGGRVSDKAIFEQSGIIQLLKNTEKLMVDKGFLIDDVCLQHGIKIVRPPFLRQKSQFSQAEALNNCNIASARVHIERLNQRLTSFKSSEVKCLPAW